MQIHQPMRCGYNFAFHRGAEPLNIHDPAHETLLAAVLAVVAILILLFLAFSPAAGV
jgi:hypothetical protein